MCCTDEKRILLVNATVEGSTGGVARIHQVLKKIFYMRSSRWIVDTKSPDQVQNKIFKSKQEFFWKPWGGRQRVPACRRRRELSRGGCSCRPPWWQTLYCWLKRSMQIIDVKKDIDDQWSDKGTSSNLRNFPSSSTTQTCCSISLLTWIFSIQMCCLGGWWCHQCNKYDQYYDDGDYGE